MEPQPHPNVSGRELELELIRVRAEAAAARLEARAAELELMLLAQRPQSRFTQPALEPWDQSVAGQISGELPDFDQPRDAAESLILAIRQLVEQNSGSSGFTAQSVPSGSTTRNETFGAFTSPVNTSASGAGGGWESRLSRLRGREAEPNARLLQRQSSSTEIEQFADRIAAASQEVAEVSPEVAAVAETSPRDVVVVAENAATTEDRKETRLDAASETVKRPRMLDLLTVERPNDSDGPSDNALPQAKVASGKKLAADIRIPERAVIAKALTRDADRSPAMNPIPISIAEDRAGDEQPKRRRPAGWLISTTAHVVGLLVLGLFTLANPKPKDQLAFTASVSEASEEVVESFTIEAAQEMPDVAEPTPTETAADVSPLGTLQMAEVTLDLPTALAPPINSAMPGEMSSESMKLAKAAVKGDTLSKVQFAGLDGGGNHFVYLVDSSNSMKKFNDARTELLRSIDSLKPDQRFYVVFYDENPKFMRVTNPSQNEPASVYATSESKQAFRRWAMTIQQERGKSPPDVLKFAFKLRPDVIFLLSDGEFTAQTETVIRENNLRDNLFGESGPISIIHTIRYPGVSSTEGRQAEVQMRRIAAENGGQYRNVEIK